VGLNGDAKLQAGLEPAQFVEVTVNPLGQQKLRAVMVPPLPGGSGEGAGERTRSDGKIEMNAAGAVAVPMHVLKGAISDGGGAEPLYRPMYELKPPSQPAAIPDGATARSEPLYRPMYALKAPPQPGEYAGGGDGVVNEPKTVSSKLRGSGKEDSTRTRNLPLANGGLLNDGVPRGEPSSEDAQVGYNWTVVPSCVDDAQSGYENMHHGAFETTSVLEEKMLRPPKCQKLILEVAAADTPPPRPPRGRHPTFDGGEIGGQSHT
jgi:hypothetical protein